MCKDSSLTLVLDLEFTPLSDNFLSEQELNQPETSYPLQMYLCDNCGLFQLGYVVPPELMYNENYIYESSVTKTLKDHFLKMAEDICKDYNIPQNSLAIDIGSNVGVLLSGFRSQGLQILGIDPSPNIVKQAIKNGIDTIQGFFSSELAEKISNEKGQASIITGTNIFAHIDNLDDLMKGINIILKDDGIFVIEAPYVQNLIDNLEYDTIYHEHLSYLSLRPMVNFFKTLDWEVIDVQWQKIHGGTLRYYVARKDKFPISKNVGELLTKEEKLYSKKNLEEFAKKVYLHKKNLVDLLIGLKRKGKKIVGVSAPAKGNTLLNYCKIGNETLDYLTERGKLKIGKFSPGTHIPIRSDDFLIKDKPDYAVILAWNFADEIMKNLKHFRDSNGKFIIPIPEPKIV